MNRVAAFRLSLLASLGIVHVACGSTSVDAEEEGEGGSNSKAGTSSKAGSNGKGGTAGSGGSSQGGSGGGLTLTCTSPVLDPTTGLVTCSEGYRHRPTAVDCELAGGASGTEGGAGGSAGDRESELPRASGDLPCDEDPTLCQAFQLGYCDADPTDGGLAPSVCLSGCVTDDDCGTGQICVCGEASPTGGKCQRSTCPTDEYCGAGSLCASYSQVCGAGGFACISLQDECVSNADCASGNCMKESASAPRTCDGSICGRPFLVEAQPRLAPAVASSDWLQRDEPAPRLDHLTLAERAALAAHWTRLGQMEHASIAAFARFGLQLLSLGAPPELVEACTRALADETAHTKLCFQIASAYAGRAIGPGALAIDGSLNAASLADIVDLAIAEGCFGETSAALDALESAETASDPVIHRAYARIAADEQRHAELAFHFVRWALEQGGAAVQQRIQAAITAPASSHYSATQVVVPCLAALVASCTRKSRADHDRWPPNSIPALEANES